MIDQATQRALGTLAAPSMPPTVVRIDDSDVVVLRSTAAGIEVWRDGAILTFAADTQVEIVEDRAHANSVLHRPLVGMNVHRRRTIQAQHDQAQQHAAVLGDIRSYAIEKYEDQNYSQERLEHFLATIGLAPYVELIRVSYGIRGTYSVAVDDKAIARHDVRHGLGVDVVSIPEAIIDTAEHAATVLGVEQWTEEQATAAGAARVFTVHFRLDGDYDSGIHDRGEAQDQCRSELLLDVTAITGLVAHTMVWDFEWIQADFVD